MELDDADTLNKLELRWIRYDESRIGGELCENIPELTICVERAELAFAVGTRPSPLRRSARMSRTKPSAGIATGRNFSHATKLASPPGFWMVSALTCRDDVMRARGLRRSHSSKGVEVLGQDTSLDWPRPPFC